MNIYILSDKKIKNTINLPVIEIKYIDTNDEIDYSIYDALVVTSKNALYSIDHKNQNWKTKEIYAIAPQTAKIAKDLGGNLIFTGTNGHGDKFALELLEKLKDKRCLYIRGAKVVSNLVKILKKNNIMCDEKIVYETVCKTYKNLELPKNSTIIFSSPSTIKCFLKNTSWDDSFKAICIGTTTSKYLPSYIKPYISDTTSLKSCVDLAVSLNK